MKVSIKLNVLNGCFEGLDSIKCNSYKLISVKNKNLARLRAAYIAFEAAIGELKDEEAKQNARLNELIEIDFVQIDQKFIPDDFECAGDLTYNVLNAYIIKQDTLAEEPEVVEVVK